MNQQHPVNADNNNRLTSTIGWGSLAFTLLITLAMLGWLIWRSRYGIDFSDESFYLVWIANPWIYSYSISQFGFIYHPLYLLVGGDIPLLRQTNILITFLLAWGVCWALFQQFLPERLAVPRPGKFAYAALGAIFASGSLTFLTFSSLWLPTPSYNSLAMQSLLIAAIGLLLAESRATRLSVIGWLLIGLAGWLTFMAKPTTAAALGVVCVCYLLASGRFNLRLLVLSVVVVLGLFLCSAWVIDGSVQAFIQRLTEGVEAGKRLNSGHTLSHSLRLDDFLLSTKEKSILLTGALLVGASTLALLNCISRKSALASLALLVPIAASLIALGFIVEAIMPAISLGPFQGLQLTAVSFGLAIATLLAVWKTPSALLNRKVIALAVSFASSTLCLCLWHQQQLLDRRFVCCDVLVSWPGSACLPVVNAKRATMLSWRALLPAAACTQAIAVALLYVGMQNRYRQPQPLRLNQHTVNFRRIPIATVVSSENRRHYLKPLHGLAEKEHFQRRNTSHRPDRPLPWRALFPRGQSYRSGPDHWGLRRE